MSRLFISHSSQDDGFVRGLQQALGSHEGDAKGAKREDREGGRGEHRIGVSKKAADFKLSARLRRSQPGP